MRACDGGRRVEKHVRIASRTRGSISIRQEADSTRRRAILVARVLPTAGGRSIPALYDVVLIGTSGEAWLLSGYERIEAGPLSREHALGQTWIIEPAAVQDLIDADAKWTAAAREANELREQLRTLTASAA